MSFCSLKKVLTTIVFAILLFPAIGQQLELQKEIVLSAKELSLKKLTKQITKQTGIRFSYSNDKIDDRKNIRFDTSTIPLDKILQTTEIQLNLKYSVLENQIILKPQSQSENNPDILQDFTIDGYIREAVSEEILVGAAVYISQLNAGTTTNSYGYYSLTIPSGKYNLIVSFLGMKDTVIPINIIENKLISVDMHPEESIIDEVVISANSTSIEEGKNQMSQITLNPKTIIMMPSLMGQGDLIKSLQAIPGIKTYGDGSVNFYVRGGNKDQNLILIDEAPIYNPAHMLGFFSTFVPEAIKDIQIYKGDIPISRGGRLSSLVEVTTKDGNMSKLGLSGNISPIASSLSLEGPIIKNKSSFFLSGRRSHFEWLGRWFPGMTLRFYDVNGKVNYKIGERDRIFISGYTGGDFIGSQGTSAGTFGLKWGNFAGTLRWNHIINDKLFINNTLYGSNYSYSLITSFERDEAWKTNIGNYSLRSSGTLYANPRNTIRFGSELNYQYYDPGNLSIQDSTLASYIPWISDALTREFVVFAGHESDIGKRMSVRYGIRSVLWQNIGPTTTYLFDENYVLTDTLLIDSRTTYHSTFDIEPRACIRYKLENNGALNVCYSRTTQNIHLISNSLSPFTSLEVWLPSGPNIKPGKADLYAAGWQKTFKNIGIDATVEGFFKNMKNQLDYKDHAKMFLNPLIEGELRSGNTWSSGVDILIRKNIGKFQGWIGYTYSKTIRKTKGINSDNPYPAFTDRPHDVAVYVSYTPYKRISIAANWVYVSGTPISTPTAFYTYQGYVLPYYGEKNNDRLPEYHRLDLMASFKLNKPVSFIDHSISISIYNVYARENAFSLNYNKIMDSNGDYVVPSNRYGNYGLLVTQLSMMKLVPSINYSFRF